MRSFSCKNIKTEVNVSILGDKKLFDDTRVNIRMNVDINSYEDSGEIDVMQGDIKSTDKRRPILVVSNVQNLTTNSSQLPSFLILEYLLKMNVFLIDYD